MSGSQSSPMFDPICGMWLEPGQIAITYTYIEEIYAFCCEECRALFVRAPEVHIASLAHEPKTSAGHLCPYQRPPDDDSLAGTEEEIPGSDR